MAMNRDEVLERVIRCLQEISPEPNEVKLNEQSNAMLKLRLDSLDGVNLACKLTEEFGCTVPEKMNPLVDDKLHRPRRVGEIADVVQRLLTAKEANR